VSRRRTRAKAVGPRILPRSTQEHGRGSGITRPQEVLGMVTVAVERRSKRRGWNSLVVFYGRGADGKRIRDRITIRSADGRPVT